MVNEAPESTTNQAVEHILIVGGPDHVGTGSGVQTDLHNVQAVGVMAGAVGYRENCNPTVINA